MQRNCDVLTCNFFRRSVNLTLRRGADRRAGTEDLVRYRSARKAAAGDLMLAAAGWRFTPDFFI